MWRVASDLNTQSNQVVASVCFVCFMCVQIRSKLRQLTLSNKAVQDREHVRETSGGKVETTR